MWWRKRRRNMQNEALHEQLLALSHTIDAKLSQLDADCEHALGQLALRCHTLSVIVEEVLANVRAIYGIVAPRLDHIDIIIQEDILMPLEIGKTTIASVQGLDQHGQPFPIDFTANPPSWSVADPTLATIAPDPTLGSEDVTGVAAGTEVLSVSVAGLSASLKFDVQATSVLTSLQIVTNPPV